MAPRPRVRYYAGACWMLLLVSLLNLAYVHWSGKSDWWWWLGISAFIAVILTLTAECD